MAGNRIAVVAPGNRATEEAAEQVRALAGDLAEVVYHPQCFLSDGHFAGPDAARAAAFVEVANDPSYDAVWFARGGYGSNRLLAAVMSKLEPAARDKAYLGYSDCGFLLGALYCAGFRRVAHGPMPQDVLREGGDAAVKRALAWLTRQASTSVEGSVRQGQRYVAFNLTVFSQLVGTPWQPDLPGHTLMLEEVAEHLYRIDRHLFHITSNPQVRKIAGLRLGRVSQIPPNDPDFASDEEAVARDWCTRSGIAWLGRADIGHDADNKVVPFGKAR